MYSEAQLIAKCRNPDPVPDKLSWRKWIAATFGGCVYCGCEMILPLDRIGNEGTHWTYYCPNGHTATTHYELECGGVESQSYDFVLSPAPKSYDERITTHPG